MDAVADGEPFTLERIVLVVQPGAMSRRWGLRSPPGQPPALRQPTRKPPGGAGLKVGFISVRRGTGARSPLPPTARRGERGAMRWVPRSARSSPQNPGVKPPAAGLVHGPWAHKFRFNALSPNAPEPGPCGDPRCGSSNCPKALACASHSWPWGSIRGCALSWCAADAPVDCCTLPTAFRSSCCGSTRRPASACPWPNLERSATAPRSRFGLIAAPIAGGVSA